MKLCKTCGQLKEEKEFYKHNQTADGLTADGLWTECKRCNINRSISWISSHRDRKKAFDRKSWKTHRFTY